MQEVETQFARQLEVAQQGYQQELSSVEDQEMQKRRRIQALKNMMEKEEAELGDMVEQKQQLQQGVAALPQQAAISRRALNFSTPLHHQSFGPALHKAMPPFTSPSSEAATSAAAAPTSPAVAQQASPTAAVVQQASPTPPLAKQASPTTPFAKQAPPTTPFANPAHATAPQTFPPAPPPSDHPFVPGHIHGGSGKWPAAPIPPGLVSPVQPHAPPPEPMEGTVVAKSLGLVQRM